MKTINKNNNESDNESDNETIKNNKDTAGIKKIPADRKIKKIISAGRLC